MTRLDYPLLSRKLAALCAIAGCTLAPLGAAPVIATATNTPAAGVATTSQTDETIYNAFVSTTDLLHGITGTGGTWNSVNGSTVPTGLNDGSGAGDSNVSVPVGLTGAAWAANGDRVSFREFFLGNGANGQGYNITEVQSIAAWQGASFQNQKYEILVSAVGSSAFTLLATVDFQPASETTGSVQGGATKVNVTDSSGILATGIDAIRFNILDSSGATAGGVVMREIDVFGTETLDVIAPQILAKNPEGSGVYPGANLVATFNENIALTGGGSITLVDTTDGSDTVVLNVADPSQVSVSGTKLTINPPVNLALGTAFDVVIGNNTIQDSAPTPNVFTGTTAGQWTFSTAAQEFAAPVITSTTPVDGASRVSISANLVVTFNQNIVADSGNIVIVDTDNGTTTQTIAVTDSSQITISGQALTINPAAMLRGGTNYAVQIDPGAVKNFSELDFAGISNTSAWNFTTMPFVINNFVDGSDAATGISSATTYTHLVDLGKDADTAVINGVSFDNTLGTYTISSLATYTAPNPLNGANPGTGMRHLLDHFRYGYSAANPPTLVLSGLTAGKTYKLRLYVSGWGPNPQTFSFDDTAPATLVSGMPRSAGQDLPSSFDYTYTLGAGDTDLRIIVSADVGNDSFHWYGFSNEEVGGNTFANWISNYPAVGAQTGVNQDPDGDGIDSGVENYFGTDPSVFSRGIVAIGKSGNTFTFTHPLNATPAADLSATYRWSTNLQDFYNNGSPNAAGTTTVTFSQSPPSAGQVTVTATISGSVIPDRLFVDVRVE